MPLSENASIVEKGGEILGAFKTIFGSHPGKRPGTSTSAHASPYPRRHPSRAVR